MDPNTIIFTNERGCSVSLGDILKAIEAGCYESGLENGLQDLKDKCSSFLFGEICLNVGKMLNDRRALWNTEHTKLNGLNKNNILLLSNIYIYLSTLYDKRICLEYFQNFMGCNGWYLTDDLRRAYNNDSVLNALKTQLLKKFDEADNTLQLSKARDSKQSILNLAYNNYRHNWSGQIQEQKLTSTVKTLEDIKRERLEKSADRVQIPENVKQPDTIPANNADF